MRARALQQVVQEQRTVIEGGDTARSDALPGASVRRLGRPRSPPPPPLGARGPRRSTPRVRRACPAWWRRRAPRARATPAPRRARSPGSRRRTTSEASAHRRGVRPGAVRPARAAGASVLLERLGLARGVGARAEQPEHVLRGLEHRGRGVRGVRSAWTFEAVDAERLPKSLRAARRGHGPSATISPSRRYASTPSGRRSRPGRTPRPRSGTPARTRRAAPRRRTDCAGARRRPRRRRRRPPTSPPSSAHPPRPRQSTRRAPRAAWRRATGPRGGTT